MSWLNVGLIALFFAVGGCSMSTDAAVAEQAVPNFHEQLDAGHFETIYAGAGDGLKTAMTQQEFVALLEAVHRKLGNTKATEKTGFTVNYDMSGSFVTLVYKTTFDGGDAQEQFVFQIDNKSALLYGYNITSTALVLK